MEIHQLTIPYRCSFDRIESQRSGRSQGPFVEYNNNIHNGISTNFLRIQQKHLFQESNFDNKNDDE